MKLKREKVIRAREMLGYGVEKTAEEAGVSKNSVLRAEHGEEIRPLTARRIAAALGVRVADLIGESKTLKARPPLHETEDDRRAQGVINNWIAFLDAITDEWLQKLWKRTLTLEELLTMSRSSSGLAGLYVLEEGRLRRWCNAEQGEALDNLKDALRRVLKLVDEQLDERYRGEHIHDVTEVLKQRRALLAEVPSARPNEANAAYY